MKSLLRITFLCLGLVGCGGSGSSSSEPNQPTTEQPTDDSSQTDKDGGNNSQTDKGGDDSSSKDSTQTSKPVAQIQANSNAVVDETVQLNTSGSTIPSGAQISWSWRSRPASSNAQFSQLNAQQTTFTPDVAGTYDIGLTITAGDVEAKATFIVTVSQPTPPPSDNTPPVADFAIAKDEIATAESLTLDASSSKDADNDSLSYQWQVTAPSNASEYTLVSPKNVQASFASDFPGEYIINLVVSDGRASHSKSATINVVADPQPSPLQAVITAPKEVEMSENTQISLKGEDSTYTSASGIEFLWSWDSKPQDSQAKFTHPLGLSTVAELDKAGEYTVRFSIKDNQGRLSEAMHTFNVVEGEPNKPIVHIDAPDSGRVNEAIELSARRSRDIDGRALSYTWTVEPKTANLDYSTSNEHTDTMTFTAHSEGFYSYSVSVSNGELSQSSSGFIQIHPDNFAPTVSITPKASNSVVGNTQSFIATGEDKDGDTLTYEWLLDSQPNGSQASLISQGKTAELTYDEPGNYVVIAKVSDGKKSATDVALARVSEAQNNATTIAGITHTGLMKVNNMVRVHAEVMDNDSAPEALTYFWKIQGPTGYLSHLAQSDKHSVSFTPKQSGRYEVFLHVVDKNSATVATQATSLIIL
ncbi:MULTISPECIES: PKD domain-containing protein [unclassified Pseudoalteromonas]|uniref:PKD domain-containing protein n=1 Tax=unclassified Pseudoalteromonas TaxID=194690 RepID=UPI003015584B